MKNRTIQQWNPEDPGFWTNTGKKIANRNLWISIPALLLAFSVWMMWSIIIVQMEKLGFSFNADPAVSKAMLYSLPAIAGLAGATLRIPNSFLVAIGGGRNVIFINTILLLIPSFGAGLALQDIHTPYLVFVLLAATSGFGGGNFASSMSNISQFFPKKMAGTALGLNAGLGNLGVSLMQWLLPITMGVALFGGLSGSGLSLPAGSKSAVTAVFIHHAGWTWVLPLLIVSVFAWFGMNNLKTASPRLESDMGGILKSLYLLLLGVIATAAGVYLLVFLKLSMWIVLPVTIVLALVLMKFLSPVQIRAGLEKQFSIFGNRHNWIMTILYVMTFGSFIGFSGAFPKLIQDVFGYLPGGEVNPNAPNPLAWAWIGPFLGAVIRPFGGWLSDKINSGSRVTQYSTILQIVAAAGVAYFIIQARQSASPEAFWWPFFISFLFLFIGAGIGNGSTFRSIPYIFSKDLAGPVLGWTSAVAAYGAFIIPKVFGQQIQHKTPEYAMYGFTVYYLVCLVLNWWFYDRKGAEVKC